MKKKKKGMGKKNDHRINNIYTFQEGNLFIGMSTKGQAASIGGKTTMSAFVEIP